MIDYLKPDQFGEYQFHKNNILLLKKWDKNNLPNILINGLKNSGKRTFILNFIKYIYNIKILPERITEYQLKINSNKLTIKIKQSIYHYEINLYEYGLYAKHILSKFIKNIIETKDIFNKFKIIVLNNFEKVNKQAQASLRKYMETYVNTCRFLIITDKKYMIDKALVSRCLNIRFKYPNKTEIEKYIKYCSNKFKFNLKSERIDYIVNNCPNDLFKLNLMIRTNISNINLIHKYINNINSIIKKKKIDFLDNIKPILYKLHLLNYDTNDFLKQYILYNIKNGFFKKKNITKILEKASETSRNIMLSSKDFFALEEFFIFIKINK